MSLDSITQNASPKSRRGNQKAFGWYGAALALLSLALALAGSCPVGAVPLATTTFIPIGFLDGDDTSYVYTVDDAVTLAGCYSYHRDPITFQRVFSYAARWTPLDGLQPLPRLSNTPNGQTPPISYVGARDVSGDGSRVAFTAPTEDLTARASAISDPDGSNLIELTSLPNGDKMEVVSQLSDDGTTAFGYKLVDYNRQGSIWTAAGGVLALTPVAGYTNIAPTDRAISSDGTVSAGDLFTVDPQGFIAAEQAYRWTSSNGVEPIPLFPDDARSYSAALSADGSKLLGLSSQVFDGVIVLHRFFLWNEGGAMTDLGIPQYDAHGLAGGGDGLSENGDLLLISIGGYSFIRREGYDYYFKFEDILTQAGAGNATAGWSTFSVTGISNDGNTLYGHATNPDGKGEGFIVTFPPDYLRGLIAPLPEITSSLTADATVGDPFVYAISASGAPEDFTAENLPSDLTLQIGTSQPGNLRVGLITGTPSVPGIYSIPITATNVRGTAAETLTLTITYPSYAPRLLNISTRMPVLLGDNVLIGGFIIPSGGPKRVILRALGPSLAGLGVGGTLSDPVLELHNDDGSVVTNDNWKDSQQSEIEDTGIPPTDDSEAAIVATLDPGSYTAIVSGKDGLTGIGLIEVYDLDSPALSKLANISTRGFVASGDNVLIGGIIVGLGGANVIARAIGPSLENSNVSNPLMDPMMEIHGEDGSLLFSNDNWKDAQRADIEATGIAPTDDRESAILATLPSGNYTAIVRGKDDTTGVGLVEVYNLN